MSFEVEFVKTLNEGLVLMRWDSYTSSDRTQLWGRVKVRKPHKCAVTGDLIPVGGVAFRPLGNVDYRMRRIAADLIDAAIAKWPVELIDPPGDPQ